MKKEIQVYIRHTFCAICTNSLQPGSTHTSEHRHTPALLRTEDATIASPFRNNLHVTDGTRCDTWPDRSFTHKRAQAHTHKSIYLCVTRVHDYIELIVTRAGEMLNSVFVSACMSRDAARASVCCVPDSLRFHININ